MIAGDTASAGGCCSTKIIILVLVIVLIVVSGGIAAAVIISGKKQHNEVPKEVMGKGVVIKAESSDKIAELKKMLADRDAADAKAAKEKKKADAKAAKAAAAAAAAAKKAGTKVAVAVVVKKVEPAFALKTGWNFTGIVASYANQWEFVQKCCTNMAGSAHTHKVKKNGRKTPMKYKGGGKFCGALIWQA